MQFLNFFMTNLCKSLSLNYILSCAPSCFMSNIMFSTVMLGLGPSGNIGIFMFENTIFLFLTSHALGSRLNSAWSNLVWEMMSSLGDKGWWRDGLRAGTYTVLSCLFCLLSLPTDLVDLLLKLALELRTDSDSLRVLKFLDLFCSFIGCSFTFLSCSISYIFLLRPDVF